MIEIAPLLFGVNVEVRFSKPRPFSKDKLDKLLSHLTDTDKGLGLRAEQIRMRSTDVGFDYELRALFLGANASLIYESAKAVLSIFGGRTNADAILVIETTQRFLKGIVSSDNEMGIFSVNANAKAESSGVRDEYLEKFRLASEIVGPGAVGYVRVPQWPEDIKFSIEPLLGVPDSFFLSWNIKFDPKSWLDDNASTIATRSRTVGAIRFS